MTDQSVMGKYYGQSPCPAANPRVPPSQIVPVFFQVIVVEPKVGVSTTVNATPPEVVAALVALITPLAPKVGVTTFLVAVIEAGSPLLPKVPQFDNAPVVWAQSATAVFTELSSDIVAAACVLLV